MSNLINLILFKPKINVIKSWRNHQKRFIFIIFIFWQDDVLCLFEVCQKISPTYINLVVKCCKPLTKVLPKLTVAEENLIKNTISWLFSSIISLENHKSHSEQIDKVLNLYASVIQICGNLNINNKEVSNHFITIRFTFKVTRLSLIFIN